MSIELTLLYTALAGYVAAGVLALAGVALKRPRDGAMLLALALAVALHTLALAMRWQRTGHGPFITMHEILSSNLWSLGLAFTIAAWRVRVVRPAGAIVMPILFVMMAWMVSTDPAAGHLPATYKTLWLFVHVLMGKVFLGAVIVAVGLAGVILARRAGVATPRLAALPDDARLENLAFRFMVVGFLFESLMLVAGAIWAQDAWGRYWAWDPLETWAFVTWLVLAGFLHARASLRLAPAAGAVMIVAVFVVAFLTFFGVPFVSVAPHKGAV